MKRIRLLTTAAVALLGVAPGFTSDPPPEGHKVFWCHYPPGQTPDKVILIIIDEHAIAAHLGHIPDHAVPTPNPASCNGGGGGG